MARFLARIKKWGASRAFVIPANVADEQHLQIGDSIEVEVRPKTVRMKDIYGLLHEELKDVDWAEVDRELAKGWDD